MTNAKYQAKYAVLNDNRFVQTLYTKYLVSSTIAVLGSLLGQIVGNMLIGNILGGEALSVISLTLPIYYIYTILGAMFGIGGATIAANYIGENNSNKTNLIYTVSWFMTIVLGLLCSVVMLVSLSPILKLLGTPAELWDSAVSYSRYLIIFGTATIGIYPTFHFLRLDGKRVSATAIFVMMAVMNLILDLVLLKPFGVLGAAVASGVAALISCIIGLLILIRKGNSFHFVINTNWTEVKQACKDIFLTGSPAALENVSSVVRTIVLNRIMIACFGSLALIALSVTGSVNSLSIVLISGAAGTIPPLAGVFIPEKDNASIRQTLKLSMKAGMFMLVSLTLFCIFLPGVVCSLFGVSSEALEFTKTAVQLFSISFLPALFCNILIYFYSSAGRIAVANLMTILRGFALIIPLAYLFKQMNIGTVMFIIFALAEALTLIITLLTIIPIRKRSNLPLERLTLLDISAEAKGTYRSFSIGNSIEQAVESAAQIVEYCEMNNLDPKRSMALSLSLEEMLVAIVQNAICDEPKLTINVRILMYDEQTLIIRIRNGGKEFNPLAEYERQLQRLKNASEDDEVSLFDLGDSLGMKMILDISESVHYLRTFGVNNLTILL